MKFSLSRIVLLLVGVLFARESYSQEDYTRLKLPEVALLSGNSRKVTSVSFSPDGSILASGSEDCTVLLWDMSPYVPLSVPIPTAVAAASNSLPAQTALLANYPNPFNSRTVISWFQLSPGMTRLEVFALTGQRVAVLHQGPKKTGGHRVHWDGRDDQGRLLASGACLYRWFPNTGFRRASSLC